ncbi:MAG: T9SS type A sorting domain-containing protein [FCB group bacterium]|nr:T9SS type A sorting domain-containing protein [FCB group bacterium]
MKHNKLLTLTLLAAFLILVSASFSYAQNSLTFGTVEVCPSPAGSTVDVPVYINNSVELAAIDIVGEVVTIADVSLTVLSVAYDTRMSDVTVIDYRFGISDLGGGVFRFGATKLNHDVNLAVADGQVATLTLEFTSDCELGSAAIDPASGVSGANTVSTTFADNAATLIVPDPITSGLISVVNDTPEFVACPDDQSIYWNGGSYSFNFDATDADLACGCDVHTYRLLNSSIGSISVDQGVYQYAGQPGDIGCNTVTVEVEDLYGGTDTCIFELEVLNVAPVVVCPDDVVEILWGYEATATATATDADFGPSGLTYSLGLGTTCPGSGAHEPQIGVTDGVFTWLTEETNAYLGTFFAEVIVTDGAPLDLCNTENADTCYIEILVKPKFRVTIEKAEGPDGYGVLQGHYYSLPIFLDDSYVSMEMGGFDFLIAYDASALTFIEATPGALLTQCGWEYFVYRFGPDGNCGNACPSGLLRVVAMAETNNGNIHPTCFDSGSGTELALLKFFVTNDRTFECHYAPVEFYWMDCGDNTISSKYGDTLFLEDGVWTFEGNPMGDPPVGYDLLPGYWGVGDDCLVGDKHFPLRAIDFKNGGIDIICADDIDGRGDINANGLMNEIADAVMFTNYFINGLAAFADHVEASIAASDVNADGTTLSVADLVYLIRVIQGDAQPYPKLTPNAESITVLTQLMGNAMTVKYNGVEAGAALFVFSLEGTVGQPTLLAGADGMEIAYSATDSEVRVLIYNIGPNAINTGDILSIPVEGTLELTETEIADFNGSALNVSTRILPTRFELAQNYPNPFNPTTTMMLAMPVAGNYNLAIYNIAGQLIQSFSGHAEASVVEVTWDGTDSYGSKVASGVYFYKFTANNFSETKKMILMK